MRMRRALLLAGAVGLLMTPTTSPASDARGQAARRSVDVLVYEPASSPVLAALRSRLGRRIEVRRATRARLRRPGRYEALIVDGDSSTPRELRRRSRVLRRFLDAGVSVVALDMRGRHFRRALDDLLGVSARPARGRRSSRVALFRREVSDGIPRMSIINARRILPWGAGKLAVDGRRKAMRQASRRLARLLDSELQAVKRPLAAPQARPPAVAAQSTGTLPPELQRMSVKFTFPSAMTMSKPWFDPNGSAWDNRKAGFPLLKAPFKDGQTSDTTVSHIFDVYLANADHPGGDAQIVSYTLDGKVSAKNADTTFMYMDEPFTWQGVFADQVFNLERAWWTGIVDASVTPSAASDGKLAVQSILPSAADSTGGYRAGNAFGVGVRLSRQRGPGIAGTVGVGQLGDYQLQDWGVTNQSAGNAGKWQFSARTNCDVRPSSYTEAGCFDLRPLSSATPNRPNALSTGTLEPHASALWQTKSMLADSTAGRLDFIVSSSPTWVDTVCARWGVAACDTKGHFTRTESPETHTVSIDVSNVVPVGIQGITFDRTTANGSNLDRITGTVTLKAPSKLSDGTNVVVYSDSRNAVVGHLIGSGPASTTTVVVPKGKTSATFDVATNDIGLQAGAKATAGITAFYTQPTSAPKLTITTSSRPADRLYPGERMQPGDRRVSPNGQYYLTFQGDGNLVLYSAASSNAVWPSNTVGWGASYAMMRRDGALVLNTAADAAVWYTPASTGRQAYMRVTNDGGVVVSTLTGDVLWSSKDTPRPPLDRLGPGWSLQHNDQLVSQDGKLVLVLQDDGNLVLYPAGSSKALWASNTVGRGVSNAVMQRDGNFVLYTAAGKPVCATHTSGNDGKGTYLRLQKDGNLVLYTLAGQALWAAASTPLYC